MWFMWPKDFRFNVVNVFSINNFEYFRFEINNGNVKRERE